MKTRKKECILPFSREIANPSVLKSFLWPLTDTKGWITLIFSCVFYVCHTGPCVNSYNRNNNVLEWVNYYKPRSWYYCQSYCYRKSITLWPIQINQNKKSTAPAYTPIIFSIKGWHFSTNYLFRNNLGCRVC